MAPRPDEPPLGGDERDRVPRDAASRTTPTAAAEGRRLGSPSRDRMGIFDNIKRAVDAAARPTQPDGRAPPASASRPAAGASSAKAALESAQKRRRAAGVTRNNGKPATKRALAHYESLERALVLGGVAMPLDPVAVRAELVRRGFDAAHVEAYLRSDAARKLLE